MLSDVDRLHGILHEPEWGRAEGLCVLFLAGPATTRNGPHRLHFRLATALERQGVRSLRFDFRGRGESEGAEDALTVRSMIEDGLAAQAEARARGLASRFVLVGNCLSCVAALRIMEVSAEAIGGIMLGASDFSESQGAENFLSELAHEARLYAAKLRRPETWRQALGLGLEWRGIAAALGSTSARKFRAADRPRAYGLGPSRFPGKTAAFVWGSLDPSLSRSRFYAEYCASHRWTCRQHVIEGGDRSFSHGASHEPLTRLVVDFVSGYGASPPDEESGDRKPAASGQSMAFTS
jgi:hypothetical protein